MLRSGPALAPSPTRLIASIPQAMPMSMAPVAIRPGDQMVGLLGAAALAVDGGGADMLGQARGQPADPGDVVGLLAVLGDAAADELLDVAGVDAGLLDDGLLDRAQEFGGVQSGQPTVALADRAAGGFDDDRITHDVRLEHVSLV